MKPEPPSDEVLHAAWQHIQRVHAESSPDQQYLQQIEEEMTSRKAFTLEEEDLKDLCVTTVRQRWIHQGIWNAKWHPYKPSGDWKWPHQEPTSHHQEPHVGIDASRPFNQFIYQMREVRRRRAEDVSPTQVNSGLTEQPDVNSEAYRVVRQTWEQRKIWYWKWTTFPGECWVHEYALEDVVREEMGDYVPPEQRRRPIRIKIKKRRVEEPEPTETKKRRTRRK